MPIPKIKKVPGGAYFLTCSTIGRIDIFTYQEFFEIIIDSLRFCQKEKELRLYGYVIMPNHLHLIGSHQSDLSAIMRDFKHFTANQIIEKLIEFKKCHTLNLLKFVGERKSRQKYQVWQHKNYPEWIETEAFFLEKLNYIHNNPVSRGFVELPEHWVYSSARNYILGDSSILRLEPLE